jgi:tetratricopeptide (TPR) repeat protein
VAPRRAASARRAVREPRVHFDAGEAARIVGVPVPRLRQCVRAGLISPVRDARGRPRFDFVDLVLLRTMRGLLARRVPMRQIARVLESLRRQIGTRPLTRLSVYADGSRVVAWDGATRWQPESGQFLFNFDAREVVQRASKLARLPARAETSPRLPQLTADEWCELAIELEEGSPLEARAAYHHALDLDPRHTTARINLGRMLHGEGNLAGAEAHYRDALRHDPTSALAWYNLGVLCEDTGRADEALAAYERAVRADPTLADAHYNLALLYERRGRRQDAVRHLAVYRRLVPPER